MDQKIEELTGYEAIDSIVKAEPLGPKLPLDCMIIAPLTGNSMSKLANAMTDSPVLMAAKATIRNNRPVVLGISTNDALGLNGTNLMRLMSTKNIFFIPFGQDDPYKNRIQWSLKWSCFRKQLKRLFRISSFSQFLSRIIREMTKFTENLAETKKLGPPVTILW